MSVITLTKDNFDAEVIASPIPVLVDFWAPWCGPCGMLTPIVDEIAQEQDGKLKVCKVNVDDNKELSRQFKVLSIPTLIIFKDGKQFATSVGVKQKEEILDIVSL